MQALGSTPPSNSTCVLNMASTCALMRSGTTSRDCSRVYAKLKDTCLVDACSTYDTCLVDTHSSCAHMCLGTSPACDLSQATYSAFCHSPSSRDCSTVYFKFLANALCTCAYICRYQSSLDLSQATYSAIRHLPLSRDLAQHARQQLVSRLDDHCQKFPELFHQVSEVDW